MPRIEQGVAGWNATPQNLPHPVFSSWWTSVQIQTWNVTHVLDSEKIFSLIWDQCIGPNKQDFGDSKYALVFEKTVGDNTNDQSGFFDMKAG